MSREASRLHIDPGALEKDTILVEDDLKARPFLVSHVALWKMRVGRVGRVGMEFIVSFQVIREGVPRRGRRGSCVEKGHGTVSEEDSSKLNWEK
jgi:hypothetical protein